MKSIFLSLLLAVSCALQALALETITVGGTARTMIVYAPSALPSQSPLIIACHGYNQDAPYLQSLAKFESVADTAGFVVVYANGLNKSWDISGDTDVKFMQAIIDEMYARYGIDRSRVYLTGFSMGGMFTYHCANRMADKIAAFAPVSGYPMGGPNPQACRPVPILHTHGTADDVCSYSPVQSHINAWVNFNGCDKNPVVVKPYPTNRPNSPAKRERYLNGRDGVEVSLITLADKGHWWSMDDAQAKTSVEVWNFCKRYSIGDPEPEVVSIVPEDCSFDLQSDLHRTFTLRLTDQVRLDGVHVSLVPAQGDTIALAVQGEGLGEEIQAVVPDGVSVPDGTYTLVVEGAVSQGGTAMRRRTYTYAYGVEQVGATLSVDTFFCPDFYAAQPTVGEGIPEGWRRFCQPSSGNAETIGENSANCGGVRLKYFERGGDFDAGFYLSARDFSSCRLAYGMYAAHRLSLQPGEYALSFNSVYWSDGSRSANATYSVSLSALMSNAVVWSESSLRSSGSMSENTAQVIQGSLHHDLTVTVGEEGLYVLNFEMQEGWNSVIVGNMLLTTMPTLADRYKGTFLRTLDQARSRLQGYEGKAVVTLQSVIDQYATLVSTSPTVYTEATEALRQAIAAFDASSDKVTALTAPSCGIESLGTSFNLAGQPAAPSACGISVIQGKKVALRLH